MNLHSNSTTDPIPHQTRRTIDEKAFILSNGAAVISAATALATFLTSVIKEQSDKHSCAVVSGTVNGVHYQYSASGRNCDTSSEEKTINAAMDRALKFMQDKRVDAACFQLTHGGTWKGLLQLAASGEPIIQNKCLSVSYPINV